MIASFTISKLRIYFFLGMFLQIPLILITKSIKLNSTCANVIFWVGLII